MRVSLPILALYSPAPKLGILVSGFGGTQALGMLVSTTLFIAMFFNILVLPSLLLVLDKYVVTKAFESEPLIEIYDGDDESNGNGNGNGRSNGNHTPGDSKKIIDNKHSHI